MPRFKAYLQSRSVLARYICIAEKMGEELCLIYGHSCDTWNISHEEKLAWSTHINKNAMSNNNKYLKPLITFEMYTWFSMLWPLRIKAKYYIGQFTIIKYLWATAINVFISQTYIISQEICLNIVSLCLNIGELLPRQPMWCVITLPSNRQAACRHKQNCNIREDWLEGVKLK